MVDSIIVSGPVIMKNGKLLVIKDNKDDFYKIPGGRQEGEEDLETTCIREIKEELNAEIILGKKLPSLVLSEDPRTRKKMRIELNHYSAELINEKELKPIPPIKEFYWLSLNDIKRKKYPIAPNISYLFEQGALI
jgi:ADP-ribose pyrophosphatase YjhB (NUDIX family)